MWLFIPMTVAGRTGSVATCRDLHSAQELADWSSASMSQNPDIELCVTSSGKLLRRPASWRGWRTRPWIRLLSGTTWRPSTAGHGVARFISSLADIHASHSVVRANAEEKTTRGTFGRTSAGSSRKLTRSGASSRTSKGISIWEPPTSSRTFKAWATQLKRDCFQRLKSVHPTYGAGSSFWPTPTKSLYCNRTEIELSDAGMRLRNDPSQTGSQIALGNATRQWTQTWLLIRAWNARPKGRPSFRSSRPLHLSLMFGHRSSTGDLTFNPSFSDWIMGWPIGWTEPMRPATEWSAWLLRMRGELSKLPTSIRGGDQVA